MLFLKNDANDDDDQLSLQPVVIPVVQRLPKKLAWLVARHGFGVVPVAEKAWYGRGLYYSTSLKYLVALTAALTASTPATPATAATTAYSADKSKENDDQVFLLSLVVPGNAFPVVAQKGVESDLQDKPARVGYQSFAGIPSPNR